MPEGGDHGLPDPECLAAAAPAAPAADHPRRPPLPTYPGGLGGRARQVGRRGGPCPRGEPAERLQLARCLCPGLRPRCLARRPAPGPADPLGGGALAALAPAVGPVASGVRLRRRRLDGALAPRAPGAVPRPGLLRRYDPPRVAAPVLRLEAVPLRAGPRSRGGEKNGRSAAGSAACRSGRPCWRRTRPTCCCSRRCAPAGPRAASPRRSCSAAATRGG